MLIKKNEAKIVDQGSKIIKKYIAGDKQLEINRMILRGRTPAIDGTYLCETKVHFMSYVVKGRGKMVCGDDIFDVEQGDCVDVPAATRFAAEGNFEYITAESPAWYPEQAQIIDGQGDVIN